jgi:acetyl esterase/lipase
MERADADMRMVLEKLMELGAKPIDQLSVEEARTQPTPADAVEAVLEEKGESASPQPVGNVEDIAIPGPAGDIPARVYTPEGTGPFPVIVYFHGGGWVIADLDVYDATPRAMVNLTDAIVVSSHYRQGPEDKFPAAHDDAVAAYKWVIENAGEFNGDSSRTAVMGESAGGGLVATVAIAARNQALIQPVHMVLVYPIAGTDTRCSVPAFDGLGRV